MERNVKIRLDGGNTIEKTTAATTYGELKSEVDLNFEDKKVIVRETRNTLESDSAILPDGDFTLFVYPVKVKSGHSYEGLGYHELRALCIERNVPKKDYGCANYGTIEEMREKLAESDRPSTRGYNVPEEESEEALDFEAAKEDLLSSVNRIIVQMEALYDQINELKSASEGPVEIDEAILEYNALREGLYKFGVI